MSDQAIEEFYVEERTFPLPADLAAAAHTNNRSMYEEAEAEFKDLSADEIREKQIDGMTERLEMWLGVLNPAQRKTLASWADRFQPMGAVGLEMRKRWQHMGIQALDEHSRGMELSAINISLSRALRLMFQSAILGFGAWLAVLQEISAGTIVAASIIMARALAPAGHGRQLAARDRRAPARAPAGRSGGRPSQPPPDPPHARRVGHRREPALGPGAVDGPRPHELG